MLFNEEFIALIEDKPVQAIVEACNQTMDKLSLNDNNEWTYQEHEILMETVALVELIIESSNLHSQYALAEQPGDIQNSCGQLLQYLESIKNEFHGQANELKMESYKNRYEAALKSSFAYEFSQGDLDRVQILINELRVHINDRKDLEAEHKRRLLLRLEKLQTELHKRVSDLDRFWGMVGDAGVVVGKLGKEAQPIVDRIKEISEIVWRTQARTEELPSNSPNPMIENDDKT